MEQIKFTRGDSVKVCHCHEGVKEALIADGWKEDKPQPVKRPLKPLTKKLNNKKVN